MPLAVALTVLFSGLLHASWNAILRLSGDRLATMALLTGTGGLIGLAGVTLVEVPARQSWPWLALSACLHLGYNVFLGTAYKYGELGKVYPLARGTAPLITLIASLLLLDERLSAHAVLGVVVLGAGIATLTLDRGWRLLLSEPRGAVFALVTSLFISGYSVSDGIGARAAGDAHAYTLWLFLLDGLPLALFILATRGSRTVATVRANWPAGCLAGALSMAAYWIVIWAMTVAPIALVAALRETSVLFAILIGVVFLKERLTLARVASVLIVLCGLVLLRL